MSALKGILHTYVRKVPTQVGTVNTGMCITCLLHGGSNPTGKLAD